MNTLPVLILSVTILTSCQLQQEGANKSKSQQINDPAHPGLSEVELRPTYLSIYENILKASSARGKCLACHAGPKPAHHLDLSTYEKIVKNNHLPPLIVPGKPEKSALYQSCADGKMPKGGPKLTEQELNALYDWIKEGASDEAGNPAPPPPPPTDDEPGEDDEESDF